MRTVLTAALLLLLGGCSSYQTPHEWCSKSRNLSRYRDYDQCYSECVAKDCGRVKGVLENFGDGMVKGSQQPPERKRCTATYSTGPGFTYAECD